MTCCKNIHQLHYRGLYMNRWIMCKINFLVSFIYVMKTRTFHFNHHSIMNKNPFQSFIMNESVPPIYRRHISVSGLSLTLHFWDLCHRHPTMTAVNALMWLPKEIYIDPLAMSPATGESMSQWDEIIYCQSSSSENGSHWISTVSRRFNTNDINFWCIWNIGDKCFNFHNLM